MVAYATWDIFFFSDINRVNNIFQNQNNGDTNVPSIKDITVYFRAMNLKSVEQVSEFQLPHASVSELAVHPDGLVSVRALDETVCLSP